MEKLNELKKDLLNFINEMRAKPWLFLEDLKEMKGNFKDLFFYNYNDSLNPIVTKTSEGIKAVEDAISFLRIQKSNKFLLDEDKHLESSAIELGEYLIKE